MVKTATKEYVQIQKQEYRRLKRIEKRVKGAWEYIEHLYHIKEARREVEEGKTTPQEEVFKKLGI